MSRLYAWLTSDTRKTEATSRGNEQIKAQINYGSKDKSLYIAEVIVTWHKGEEKPSVQFFIARDIPHEISHVH